MSMVEFKKEVPTFYDVVLSFSCMNVVNQPIYFNKKNLQHWFYYLIWRFRNYFSTKEQFKTLTKSGDKNVVLGLALTTTQKKIIKDFYDHGYCIKGIIVPSYENIQRINKGFKKNTLLSEKSEKIIFYIEFVQHQLYKCIVFINGLAYTHHIFSCPEIENIRFFLKNYALNHWLDQYRKGLISIILDHSIQKNVGWMGKNIDDTLSIEFLALDTKDCHQNTPLLLFENFRYKRFNFSKSFLKIFVFFCHFWALGLVGQLLFFMIQEGGNDFISPYQVSSSYFSKKNNLPYHCVGLGDFFLKFLGPVVLKKLSYPKKPYRIAWDGKKLFLNFDGLNDPQKEKITKSLEPYQEVLGTSWKKNDHLWIQLDIFKK